ncbi:hypothetical protein SBV1_2680007 [Verrucomicrobia bacterium]|nr:hypothetical protein SBV1_2680007 [Verrucomicrobiota bacterium]
MSEKSPSEEFRHAPTVPHQTAWREITLTVLREGSMPASLQPCDEASKAAAYWHACIANNPYVNSLQESFAVLMLDSRHKITGHQLVYVGTLDHVAITAREVFRGALVSGAAAIILMHNHPSGDPDPSEADVLTTRELCSAGRLLRINLLDHVVIGAPTVRHPKGYCSLRALDHARVARRTARCRGQHKAKLSRFLSYFDS